MEFDKKNNIDQQLYEKLYSQEVAPSDDLWAKIAGDIEEQKPKILWWNNNYVKYAAFLLISLLGGGVGYISIINKSFDNENSKLNNKNVSVFELNKESISLLSKDSLINIANNKRLITSKNESDLFLKGLKITDDKHQNIVNLKLSMNSSLLSLNIESQLKSRTFNTTMSNKNSTKEVESQIVDNQTSLSSNFQDFQFNILSSNSLMKVNHYDQKGNVILTNSSVVDGFEYKEVAIGVTQLKKKDSMVIVNQDTVKSKMKQKSKDINLDLNLKPEGVVFQTNFAIPDYDNLSAAISKDDINTRVSCNIRSKSFTASAMFTKELNSNFELHLGLSYQQTNFQLSKYTSEKMDKSLAVKFDTLLNNYVQHGTTTQITTYVGYDSNGKIVYLSPVDSPLFPDYFSPKLAPEIVSNSVYLGVPIELLFKKNISNGIQFELLVGTNCQYLIYNSSNSELPIKSQLVTFNYYGSIGLGYSVSSKLILSTLLNVSKTNKSQFSLFNETSKSQILFAPELRLNWSFD